MLLSKYIPMWVVSMKKILFFESSHFLQKAVKLILSNTNKYNVTIVDHFEKFEKENRSHHYDLIISHIDLIKLPIPKKNLVPQNLLLLYEKLDSIDEFKNYDSIHFIEKPFTTESFTKKIDFILGFKEFEYAHKSALNPTENHKISEQFIHFVAQETVEKWLREKAPQFAKDVIRDEILKLIS